MARSEAIHERMPNADSRKIDLPVFAGQGTTRTSLKLAANQAVLDMDSAIGSLLLSSCRDVFLEELAALSPDELDQSGICPSDFIDPHSLLTPDLKYPRNHVVNAIFLFVAQVLRYQSYTETTSRSFLDILDANTDHAVGVLGLSSGIFPACVVAASRSPLSYVTTAVEVFRLVFWVSFRVLQHTRRLLKEKPVDATLPWSVVCLGLKKASIAEHITLFEQQYGQVGLLRITAVLEEKHVTVSGRPDILAEFSTFVSQHCTVHPTTIDALYHSDLHFPGTRDTILQDVDRRHIRFPDYRDLHCPLRSTVCGEIAKASSDYPSLVGMVVDMVVVHPVYWNLVAEKVGSVVPTSVGLSAINIGPGSSSLRALERAMPEGVLACIDATSYMRDDGAPTCAKQEPIAVIGMAAHTPGAVNTAQLWELLATGVNTVSKIPEDRFKLPLRSSMNAGSSACDVKAGVGNFMSDFADFDHSFFGISPEEARSMDPQQRVLLHTAYEALESAGYVSDATACFQRATFGCYIGSVTQEYTENLANANNIDNQYSTGTLRAFLSGRISCAMELGGPSVVFDTACSASIVAIHQACRALMLKDCNAALAGGINVMSGPTMYVGLDRAHFLSPSGQCKAFDASADGYCRSEGSCVFVLKRLSDAVAENDNILGIIRGVEVNQCGLASSITHPHGPTQANLLKTLLECSGTSPTRVSVVEAHGTGTEAGDPCELESIRLVFSQGRTRDNPLHVTSIKGNIGHLEPTSGAIGLCKLLLMLQHNMIPAQISLKKLNPLIAPLEVDNTVIDRLPTPWVTESGPRVAVLNNFGASGSNGALIVEEHIQPERSSITSTFVFGISAKSAEALERLRSRYMQWLCDVRNYGVLFCDIAYTATARRQIYPYRLAVSARDKDQLIQGLEAAPVTRAEGRGGRVIFVFPGQGSQYLDMGASLYATSPIFRGCIDHCQHYLVSLGYHGILPIISSGSSDTVLEAAEKFEAIQCAVLAIEFALTTLWKHWGVVPAGVIGYSLGEYAAMVAADVLSIETALFIVAKRARLISQACPMRKTGMMSVALSSEQVQEILTSDGSFSNLSIACVNTNSSCVVSGPIEELQKFASHVESAFDCNTVMLSSPLGFHSSTMDPILDDLRDHAATLPIHPPSIPIVSSVSGTVIPADDRLTFQADYFAKHCRQPVQFARGLGELERYVDASEIDAWIDAGPHALCLPMVESTLLPSRESLCLPSMLKDTSPWDTLMGSLVHLYGTNVPVNWRRVFNERGTCSCISLPSYPFNSQKFLVPYRNRGAPVVSEPVPHALSPRSVVPSRSRFDTRTHELHGTVPVIETDINNAEESRTNCSGSTPKTLVSANEDTLKKHLLCMDRTGIRKIMAEVLGFADNEEIKDESDFGTLGLDSLGCIEAQQALRVALNKPIPHDIFSRCSTLSALCDFFADDLHKPSNPDIKVGALEKRRSGVDRRGIREIMAEVLGIEDSREIKDEADFGSLGLDSLGCIEAQQALRDALNKPIPHDIFSRYSTLSALSDFFADAPKGISDSKISVVEEHRSATPDVRSSSGGSPVGQYQSSDVDLLPLQQSPGSSYAPLYLVHDGSGLASHYEHILPLHRDVWGISNPRFFGDGTWETLEEMAQAYAFAIERQANGAAFMLGGWSFGGTAAYEIARILTSRGAKVKGIVLIDSPPPLAPPVLSDDFLNQLLRDRGHAARSSKSSLVFRQFKQNSDLLRKYTLKAQGTDIPLSFLRCTAEFCVDGVDGVPAWLKQRDKARVVGPWEALVGRPISAWDLPGHHFELFSPAYINETSAQLARACEYLETL